MYVFARSLESCSFTLQLSKCMLAGTEEVAPTHWQMVFWPKRGTDQANDVGRQACLSNDEFLECCFLK